MQQTRQEREKGVLAAFYMQNYSRYLYLGLKYELMIKMEIPT